MPRKVFVAGEILTAADVNTNLMDQAVMVFDDSTARGSAIPSPSEGMLTYLKDTDALEKYTTAWETVGNAGIGSNVIQTVKSDAFTTTLATGATTALTGLSATITPSSTTSKILILCSVVGSSGSASRGVGVILRRSTTEIGLGDAAGSRTQVTTVVSAGGGLAGNATSGIFLDSPASATSTTYDVLLHNADTVTQTLYVNRGPDDTDTSARWRSSSTITVMEVAG